MIEVTNLTKKYGSLTVVHEVSFRVGVGEIVGLLGPNGAGKTTTMRMMTGYLPPTSGTVMIGGRDLLKEPKKAKARIGYLPENLPLYPELTVEESLRFVAGLHDVSDIKTRMEEVLLQTGIEGVRKRLLGNLSRGYRQRVGIAQALIHDPDVLILDEPMIGLDPKQIQEIRGLLKTLGGKRAIIFSSHILQEVNAVCERVIIIHQGRIVADSLISELTSCSGKRRYVVTASESGSEMKGVLERVPGVEKVQDYTTDIEALFLRLTEEKKEDVASH